MKYYLKLLIFGVYFCALNSKVVALQTTPESEAKARQDWLQKFNNATSLPNEKSIPLISDGIRRLGDQSIFHDQEAARPVYQEGQRILLSIPGHATYYRDKINALREQLLAGKLSLEDWDEKKSPYFKVLGHLPSEEAVEVLCGFAGDDFATGGSEDRKNAHIPGMKEWRFSDYDVDFTVCLPAIKALRSLQIDNAPSVEGIDAEKYALVWRQWWQEVKTGKRKYRFKGSDVWHPVNAPTGAEREVRRPDRHPGSTAGTKGGGKPLPAAEARQDVKPENKAPRWLLLIGIAAILTAAAIHLIRRRSKDQ